MTADRAPLTYEGRVLPRQDEEVVDQGLAFDVTTLLNRRRVLQLLGAGAGALTLAACSPTPAAPAPSGTASSSGDEIPEETAGPYPGDGSNGPDVLERSGVVRSDIRSSFGTGSAVAAGVPMTLALTVTDLADGGAPLAGAAVYVWHCDREGRYSLYSDGVEGEDYLRGVQVADAHGVVRFTSVFPACYAGRWPHVHVEVYPSVDEITDSTKAIATSQVALPKRACDAVYATDGYEQSVANLGQVSLASDGVFGDDGGEHQLGTATGGVEQGWAVALAVPVDTTTAPGGGGAAGRPPGGPPTGRPLSTAMPPRA